MLNASTHDSSQSLNNWINNRLSSILNFPVTQDLVTYILSIENPRDLKEYLGTLLDLGQPHHLQFYAELVQKKQGNFGDIPGVQSYKKQNKDDNYVSTKTSEKKKKDRNKGNRVQDENNTIGESPKENTGKKKTKFINLYSQEGLAKDVILLKGRHMCNCQASKHRLVNNCLKCGRVVCEQEGSGPCLFCNNLTMKSVRWSVILVMLAFIASSGATQQGCAAKSYGIGKIVCVCNSTYCDTLEPINYLPVGTYLLYTSTKEGLRFHETIGNFNSSPNKSSVVMKVDRSVKYQVIEGFGTAFTDAAGINALSLSQQTQDNFISSYFSPRGIELNIGRVPIAGSDFSTHTYTYNDDREDIDLKKFNLTLEDFTFKIPFIKLAQKQSKSKIKLISAAWTSPPWTKTNDDYSGFGFLKAQYYQYWADYLVRFLDEYKKEGLEFWAISTGNEPVNGIIPINRFNSLGWTPHSQRSWIAENFGPALRKSQHKNIKLLAIDDQRFMLPWWVNILMSDEKAADYIDGIAVHWYWDTMFPPSLLDYTHDNYPNKFLISTEASVGDKPWDFVKVKLGSWARGESYMDDIIQDLTHWVVGWVDWNMALDLKGGPNWAKNHIDSAVIVNTTADEFYKQPMFYALGHFSKFLPEGSVRIGIEPIIARGIKSVAFERPDSGVAIIIYNEKNANTKVTIFDASRGYINIVVKKRSFNTIVYW